ncbi:hypothetical protein [Burkholderia ubonensis]|uniref:hypothetical protein n=1 Tax=Burkholderia ubonensis TaxID=101571 RepID=UPI0008FDD645|nr:hypothetical protein [Burkholderia ubonensis]OJB05641.1 hypothetical protein BGV50_03120 [Burkholderia ubonensis]
MEGLDLSKAKKVVAALSENYANEKIQQGWVLLATASGKDEMSYPLVKYSLGWFKDENPPL